MELGESEAVGVLDDQGVCGGKVDARLDNGGGDENVDIAVYQQAPDVLQLILIHPSVGGGNSGIGHIVGKACRHEIDGLYLIIKV